MGLEGNSHLGLNTAARLNEHTPAPHLKTFRDHIQSSQIAEAVEQTLGVGEACRLPPVSDVIQWVYSNHNLNAIPVLQDYSGKVEAGGEQYKVQATGGDTFTITRCTILTCGFWP